MNINTSGKEFICYIYIGTPHFIAFNFIVLHRYCVFDKLKVSGNFALSKSSWPVASLLQKHLLT